MKLKITRLPRFRYTVSLMIVFMIVSVINYQGYKLLTIINRCYNNSRVNIYNSCYVAKLNMSSKSLGEIQKFCEDYSKQMSIKYDK